MREKLSTLVQATRPNSPMLFTHAKSNSVFSEGSTSINWNARVSGQPRTSPNSTPDTLNLGAYTIAQAVERPNQIGDFGAIWLVCGLSNTFRVEDFQINGLGSFSDFFSITRPIANISHRRRRFATEN